MKKTLLLLSILGSCFISNLWAQQLETENFEALTVGNLTTNINESSAGQGGYYVGATGGAVTDFQVVSEGGIYGKVLQVTGSSAALGKYAYKKGLTTSWAARTVGNNVVDVEFDFYSGATTTSLNGFAVVLYNADFTKQLAGITYTANNRNLRGIAYYNNAGTNGNFAFGLGATTSTPIVLAVNTWNRIGFSFNKTTGEVRWKGPGFDGFVMGAGTGVDIAEIDIASTGGTGNTVSTTAKFDNYTATAKSASNLLKVNQNTENSFAVYPNPTTDMLNISNTNNFNIQSLEIADINGRVVKNINSDATSFSVSELSAGVYFLKISTESGVRTTKFLKQ